MGEGQACGVVPVVLRLIWRGPAPQAQLHGRLGDVAGKHGKYAYVERRDGWYVKVRVFKNRDEKSPDRYLVVGPKRRDAPPTFPVLKEEDLPEEVRPRLYEV